MEISTLGIDLSKTTFHHSVAKHSPVAFPVELWHFPFGKQHESCTG